MQQNPVLVTDFATGKGHGRREEGPCPNAQDDPSEGRRMLVSTIPRTER